MRELFTKFIGPELSPDALLITCGLPASFKTRAAEEVAKIKSHSIIQTDKVRLEVLKGKDIFDENIALDMDKREEVYEEVFRRADESLAKSRGIILDATFVKQSLRKRAAGIADKNNLPFIIMQTTCPEELSLAIINKRSKENYESNALTEHAYLNNKAKFEEIDLDDMKEQYPNLDILHFVVDIQGNHPEDWYVIEANRR